jgi:GNAT superfamily N-acetyltransferase
MITELGRSWVMPEPAVQIRPARRGDAEAVAGFARDLAQSFPFSRDGFDASYPELLADDHACLLVAVSEQARRRRAPGLCARLLAPRVLRRGPVAWVEEIVVREQHRRGGAGQRLMSAFEAWAAGRGSLDARDLTGEGGLMNSLSRVAGTAVDRMLGLSATSGPYVLRRDLGVPTSRRPRTGSTTTPGTRPTWCSRCWRTAHNRVIPRPARLWPSLARPGGEQVRKMSPAPRPGR